MGETAGEHRLPLPTVAFRVRLSARSMRPSLAARSGCSDGLCRRPDPVFVTPELSRFRRNGANERAERRRGWSLRDLVSQRELPPIPINPLVEKLKDHNGTVDHFNPTLPCAAVTWCYASRHLSSSYCLKSPRQAGPVPLVPSRSIVPYHASLVCSMKPNFVYPPPWRCSPL